MPTRPGSAWWKPGWPPSARARTSATSPRRGRTRPPTSTATTRPRQSASARSSGTSLRGSESRELGELAVPAAVEQVDDEPDGQPDEEPDPVHDGQPGHEEQAEGDGQDRSDGA